MKKTIMLFLSLVAIAILVVSCVPKEESAVAGEAIKLSQVKNACTDLEKCGFSKFVFVNEGKINDFYNSYAGRYLAKTGTQVCSEMGYGSCVASVFTQISWYLDSSNTTCSGKAQMVSSGNFFRSCDQTPHESYCYQDPEPLRRNRVEPFLGDMRQDSLITGVFCSR